jgi:cell division protein FtsZ
LNITGGPDMGLFEVNEAAEVVTGAADQNANVIFGAVIDQGARDEVRVTVIATGFGPERYRRRRREREAQPVEEGAERERPTTEDAFELPDDVLEVPSFLREP